MAADPAGSERLFRMLVAGAAEPIDDESHFFFFPALYNSE